MEGLRRGRRFLAVLSIRSNGSMRRRVAAPLQYAAKASFDRRVALRLAANRVALGPLCSASSHASEAVLDNAQLTRLRCGDETIGIG
jgi:hypothetical protein